MAQQQQQKKSEREPFANENAEGSVPLRITNIAPTHGERTVGYVPYGLTAVRGQNMAGKSRLLAALECIPVSELRAQGVTITDGETRASVSLGTAAIHITEKVLAGNVRRKIAREAEDAEGEITTLPDPIEQLVTGRGLKDDDAALRARISALNDFLRVDVTADRLAALCGPLLDFDRGRDLATWLQNEHDARPYDSLLEAVKALSGRKGELFRRALEAEAEAREAHDSMVAMEGRAEQVVAASAWSRDELLAPSTLHPTDDVDAARELALDLARRHERSLEAQERRLRLAADHGGRPDYDTAVLAYRVQGRRVASLREQLSSAEQELGRLEGESAAQASLLAKWKTVEGLLNEPRDEVTDEQVRLADADYRRIDNALTMAYDAERLDEAESEVKLLGHLEDDSTGDAAELRACARDSWYRLGTVLTDAHDSEILRMHDGQLQVNAGDDVGWVDVANHTRLSRGRLRRAVLDFYLDAADAGQNVIVDESLILPIDPAGRRDLSERCRERRIRMLFEEPAEVDEPEVHTW
jgi:hypothetical protein